MAPKVDPVLSDEVLPARADVVVIGGGIIGASTALFLAQKGIRASGNFVSVFAPDELQALVRDAGFKHVQRISAVDLAARYFSGRPDDLRPSSALRTNSWTRWG